MEHFYRAVLAKWVRYCYCNRCPLLSHQKDRLMRRAPVGLSVVCPPLVTPKVRPGNTSTSSRVSSAYPRGGELRCHRTKTITMA
jgi:hypothetical protein